jgi:hypothetical protein
LLNIFNDNKREAWWSGNLNSAPKGTADFKLWTKEGLSVPVQDGKRTK